MIRLKGYDYSQRGCYFVTICAHQKRNLFGAIPGRTVEPNAFGRIVIETWHDLPNHYADVHLDSFVLMPNHVHGILVLTRPAWAGLKPAPTKLSEVVRALKTFSAKRVNRARDTIGQPVWQRNYFERIIRSPREHDAIRRYISENPLRWAFDRDNPDAIRPVDNDRDIVGANL